MARIYGSYNKENARLESKLFKVKTSEVKQAKRKLKYECGICGKPILKGQYYVVRRRFVGFGYAFQYAHVSCLEEVDSDDSSERDKG